MSTEETATEKVGFNIETLMRLHKDTFSYAPGGGTWTAYINKSIESSLKSNQGITLGRQEHPFNRKAVIPFLHTNEHHGACIRTKASSTVGLGHVFDSEQEKPDGTPKPKSKRVKKAADPSQTGQPGVSQVRNAIDRLLSEVDVKLDPLCRNSWSDTLGSCAEDYWNIGEGFIEVVREAASLKILGLHYLPAPSVYINIENEAYDFHYEIVSEVSSNVRKFARFGDTKSFLERNKANTQVSDLGTADVEDANKTVSEVIHFRNPNSTHRWYGVPDWLAAVPSIELGQCLHQHQYDFYLNRGVPEFMLFMLGAKLTPEDWKKVTDSLRANIGLGNSHKSMALNIQDEGMKVQLEKLAMESSNEDTFGTVSEVLAIKVVTSHRVPPLLAGIMVPGKLGSNNELPNAMMAFQALVIGPGQRVFMQTLGRTLGSDEAGLGLTLTDFEFYTILDEIDLSLASTVGGMKQPLAEANAQGRDLSAGQKH